MVELCQNRKICKIFSMPHFPHPVGCGLIFSSCRVLRIQVRSVLVLNKLSVEFFLHSENTIERKVRCKEVQLQRLF